MEPRRSRHLPAVVRWATGSAPGLNRRQINSQSSKRRHDGISTTRRIGFSVKTRAQPGHRHLWRAGEFFTWAAAMSPGHAAGRHLPGGRSGTCSTWPTATKAPRKRFPGQAIRAAAPGDHLPTKATFAAAPVPTTSGSSRHHLLRAGRQPAPAGTDYIDLFQPHAFDAKTPIEETSDAR